jgi:hypothetical protein
MAVEHETPYTDEIIGDGKWIRTFDCTKTDSHEYVWHRDRNDRFITATEGFGWKFQMDDEVPMRINIGETIFIPKDSYHRIIIGKTPLKLIIEEVQ